MNGISSYITVEFKHEYNYNSSQPRHAEGLDNLMNTHLYHHVTCVNVYLKIMEKLDLNNEFFDGQCNSVDWYIIVSNVFDKYLCLSDTYKLRLWTENIINVIENKQIRDKDFLIQTIEDKIPKNVTNLICSKLNILNIINGLILKLP